jgi:hypothetical protein
MAGGDTSMCGCSFSSPQTMAAETVAAVIPATARLVIFFLPMRPRYQSPPDPAYTRVMVDHWRVSCSCGRWRAYTQTDLQARLLALEHGHEQGQHLVTVESRDNHRRRTMAAEPQHPRSI